MTIPTISMVIPNRIPDVIVEHAALKIPEILENIFKFCNFDDLKTSRQVSNHWRNAAKRFWVAFAQVRIQEIGKENDKLMSEYLHCAAEDDSHSLVNFNIRLYSRVFNFPTLLSFWEMCGQQIKMLKLDVNQFPNSDSVRDILFKYCPNMTHLSFIACYSDKRPVNSIYSPIIPMGNFNVQENTNVKWISFSPESIISADIFWMELFTNYPNLQGLQMLKFVTEQHAEEIFTTINSIREQDHKKLKLKSIRVLVSCHDSTSTFGGIPSSLLKFLLSSDILIENLALTLSSTEDIHKVRQILSIHGSTLKTLELDTLNRNLLNDENTFLSDTLQIQATLPRLSKLTLSQSVLKFLAFLKYIPNLRKLVIKKGPKIYNVSYPKVSETTLGPDVDDFAFAYLTELEMDHYENPEGVSKLIRWFPNVETVKIPLSNESFELACKGWPNLKSLNIPKSTVDECGLTGLDGSHVIRINMARGNFCKRPATVPRANITALKHLKSFHMRISSHCSSPYSVLSFCSVTHGFQSLACPENISVKDYPINEELWSLGHKTEKDHHIIIW